MGRRIDRRRPVSGLRILEHGMGGCYWWLRSPGYAAFNAAFVDSGGYVDSYGSRVYYDVAAVRPALWVSDL